MTTPVRDHLVSALYADLVGPFEGAKAHDRSRELIRRPSEWYLTGFLVPDKNREPDPDELDGDEGEGDSVPTEDGNDETPPTKVPKLFAASLGLSVLLPAEAKSIRVDVSFAHYAKEKLERNIYWRRVPQPIQSLTLPLSKTTCWTSCSR